MLLPLLFDVDVRGDDVYIATPPVSPRKLIKHKPLHLRSQVPALRGQLLESGARVHLAVRNYRARSGRSAHGCV